MEFLDPGKILNKLKLRPEMIAADFGCGSGGFTIPLAKRLEGGLIHALDVQKAPLSVLKGRLISEGINNIKTVHCDLEKPKGSTLPDSSLDLILIVDTLFQADDKDAIIFEAERVLKPEGELLVIDWVPGSLKSLEKKGVSSKEVGKVAKKLKLNLKEEFEAGKYHYGLIFQKS